MEYDRAAAAEEETRRRLRLPSFQEIKASIGRALVDLGYEILLGAESKDEYELYNLRVCLRDAGAAVFVYDQLVTADGELYKEVMAFDKETETIVMASIDEMEKHPIFSQILQHFAKSWAWTPRKPDPPPEKPHLSKAEKKELKRAKKNRAALLKAEEQLKADRTARKMADKARWEKEHDWQFGALLHCARVDPQDYGLWPDPEDKRKQELREAQKYLSRVAELGLVVDPEHVAELYRGPSTTHIALQYNGSGSESIPAYHQSLTASLPQPIPQPAPSP